MLYAKKRYVTDILKSETTIYVPDINWLHNKFNRPHLMLHPNNKIEGVGCVWIPSRYKVNKALEIMTKRHKTDVIYNMSSNITVIFYYTAHLLLLRWDSFSKELTIYDRAECEFAELVKERCTEAIEKDHKIRMKGNAAHIDVLIDKLTTANQLRKKLEIGWKENTNAKHGEVKEIQSNK